MTAAVAKRQGEARRDSSTNSAGEDSTAQAGAVIDEPHLRCMTLGDAGLEREVLQIFLRQTVAMLERIAGGEPAIVGAAAHTLMGSARGIGAWRLAGAAQRLEQASAAGSDEALGEAITELKAASLEASAAIAARLSAPTL